MNNSKFSNEQIAQLLAIKLVSKCFEPSDANSAQNSCNIIKKYTEIYNNLINGQILYKNKTYKRSKSYGDKIYDKKIDKRINKFGL